MKCYTCTYFEGHWLAGSVAVVWASDRKAAAAILEIELRKRSLPQTIDPKDMIAFGPKNQIRILCDGNY